MEDTHDVYSRDIYSLNKGMVTLSLTSIEIKNKPRSVNRLFKNQGERGPAKLQISKVKVKILRRGALLEEVCTNPPVY